MKSPTAISRPSPLVSTLTLIACGLIFWAGVAYPAVWTVSDSDMNPTFTRALVELAKLTIAATIGWFVTMVHAPASHRRKSSLPVAHAQILFCVAGALTMIIIGDSLARAFGAVGVASTVRFRTPMKDPKDATVLFLLIGLGMSVGRGILAISAVGTALLCVLLWMLDHGLRAESRLSIEEAASAHH